jgi:Holliday junction resolvase RusA-like endonuclease
MIRLAIPLEIPSQNVTDRMHWRTRTRHIQTWRIHVAAAARRIGATEATGPMAVRIISYRRRRITDAANLVGGAKATVDALTRAGLIQDDSDDQARITYEQRLASEHPTGRPCTIIELEPIP